MYSNPPNSNPNCIRFVAMSQPLLPVVPLYLKASDTNPYFVLVSFPTIFLTEAATLAFIFSPDEGFVPELEEP